MVQIRRAGLTVSLPVRYTQAGGLAQSATKKRRTQMCLAVPMTIKKVEGDMAVAEAKGVETTVNISLTPGLRINDKVIIHAGFVIEKLDAQEAEKIEEIWEQYEQLLEKE